ncbi:Hypothetical predicted protein [Xyrichtys novacula]|uniref:Uncharacterized protein n=1 Tax=Xyrichtys novacula TaxID=13765 RepID=A0AAV1GQP1_XYRNO|nr:Hypothetical predicted protein [Xyrichtys novacula]
MNPEERDQAFFVIAHFQKPVELIINNNNASDFIQRFTRDPQSALHWIHHSFAHTVTPWCWLTTLVVTAALGQTDRNVAASLCLQPLRPPPHNTHNHTPVEDTNWEQGGLSVLLNETTDRLEIGGNRTANLSVIEGPLYLLSYWHENV